MCNLLQKLWKRFPDQRLGQLLENYAFSPKEMWFIEDDWVETRLEMELKEGVI